MPVFPLAIGHLTAVKRTLSSRLMQRVHAADKGQLAAFIRVPDNKEPSACHAESLDHTTSQASLQALSVDSYLALFRATSIKNLWPTYYSFG